MPRCSAGGVTSAVPTTVRGPNLYATATSGQLVVREIGAFNTTTTSCRVGVGIATAAGTRGTGLTEVCESDPTHTVLGEASLTHTADATISATTRNTQLGAAVGAGIIWTFGDNGLIIPEGATNGVVIVCPSGTGQNINFYFVWDE